MAAISQCRALAGSRAMTLTYKNSSAKPFKVCNGTKWTMKRKDSFMVEIEVADDETEDQAVKRYMKCVVQSGVINKLRARRRKETKIEAYKRRLQERAQIRKLKIVEPTWEEFYGLEEESRPFEEYFRYGEYVDDIFFRTNDPMPNLVDFNMEGYNFNAGGYNAGGYNGDPYSSNFNAGQGGYIAPPAEGGYMDQQQGWNNSYGQQQGGFVGDADVTQQGGYVYPDQQQQGDGEVMYRFDQQEGQQ